MSKSFDEGGAKGLLLVNLGVGERGCNIVFDSSSSGDTVEEEENNEPSTQARLPEGPMDVTSLTQKLESLLQTALPSNDDDEPGGGIHNLPLVPQLTGLRAEMESLDAAGFVDGATMMPTVGPKTPGRRRYHAGEEEEQEADRTIHKEQRSRAKAVMTTAQKRLWAAEDDDGSSPAPAAMNGDDDDGFVDFGGGFDDDDDGFDTFIATNGPRYSDISFSSANNNMPAASTTTHLLDAIASGQTVLAESDYSYFNNSSQAPGGNLWAGAAHWKRAPASSKKAAPSKKKKSKKAPSKKKAAAKQQQLVPFPDEIPDVSHLLGGTKKKKGSKASTTTTTQWSKAMVTKHTNQENLLPPDAEFKVEQLTQLFLLPNTVLTKPEAAVADDNNNNTVNKTVNFHLPDWDDGSFGGGGDDDDGPGFDFGGGGDDMHDDDDDDEFLVQHELEGVRKVDKVQVGYAVVAKKVDVKRLKRDLWAELEQTFAGKTKSDEDDDSVDSETKDEEAENGMSFQDAVHDLEQQKTQMDVTLPFYFICILHLANEKGLRLESQGLDDFTIHNAAAS